jgi:hypothetical protein
MAVISVPGRRRRVAGDLDTLDHDKQSATKSTGPGHGAARRRAVPVLADRQTAAYAVHH